LNQNRNQNRRRGRGGNRGGQGGNQGNRIDSRARGNAPQMLEKYKKLAHDASLNGDRVQTEYYLQFADHYFRVIADMRAQKEEPRPRREHDRDGEREQAFDDGDDFDDLDEPGRGRQPQRGREEADERPSDEGRRGAEGDEVDTIDADDNPFTRDTRSRGSRSRGRGRPPANDADADAQSTAPEEDGSFDAGILPPSIARDEETPRRSAGRAKRRPRPDEDGEEALEAVS
jgi:hypothetical protein